MNFTLAAMLGLTTLAQPPAPDYYPFNTRNIKLPIDYKKDRRAIAQLQLYVCENGDQVWKQVAAAPPTQDAFVFSAPTDGLYWFHIVIVDMQGRKDPPNLTTEPPAMKVLVDTTRPYTTFTNARREGEEITIEWKIEDRYPEEAATRVYFRDPAAVGESWKEVTLHPSSRNGVRFKCGTNGPVQVRVAVQDMAGNTGEGLKDFPAPGANPQTSTSMSPGSPGSGGLTPPGSPGPVMPPSGVIPPPDSLVPPVGSGGVASPGSSRPVAPPSTPVHPLAGPSAPGGASPIAVGGGTGASVTPPPSVPAVPTPPPPSIDVRPPVASAPGNVLAVGSGATPAPTVELSRVQVINYLRFDMAYEVEQRGPSGISRVDLWVTRDDGRSWMKWSQHGGRETPVHVALDTRTNTVQEGLYGFRLVPVSGAGLSDPAPVSGDAPDMRVVVDITPPVVKIFAPESDPMQRDTLLIQWEAIDRNFGEDPITLEWSEHPNGPWRSVAATGGDGIAPATAIGGAMVKRLPNSGRYPWRVPVGLPPKVYLKVAARDAAGNTTEVVTPAPILVDLTKPRAKITGIGGVTPVLQRQ